jgi:hypothetical protein
MSTGQPRLDPPRAARPCPRAVQCPRAAPPTPPPAAVPAAALAAVAPTLTRLSRKVAAFCTFVSASEQRRKSASKTSGKTCRKVSRVDLACAEGVCGVGWSQGGVCGGPAFQGGLVQPADVAQ